MNLQDNILLGTLATVLPTLFLGVDVLSKFRVDWLFAIGTVVFGLGIMTLGIAYQQSINTKPARKR